MKTKLRNWLLALAAAGTLSIAVIRQAAIDAGLNCADAQSIADVICQEQDADCLVFALRVVPDVCTVAVDFKCAEMANGDLCRYGKVVSGPSWTGRTPVPTCDPALGRPVPCVARQGLMRNPHKLKATFDRDEVRAAIERIRGRVDGDLGAAIPDV